MTKRLFFVRKRIQAKKTGSGNIMEGGKTSESFWQKALLINPYYFALILLGMFGLNVYHVVSLDQIWTLSPIYFLVYALTESFLEVLVLVFIGNVVKTYLPRACYFGFVSLCFFFFTLHYVDFMLTRFMDISIFYGLHWIFSESLDNFIEILHITGISIQAWAFLLAGAVIIIPMLAMTLYGLTGRLAKQPLKITHKGLAKTLFCLPIGLMALDLTVTSHLDRNDYHYYQRILPWKSTLIAHDELTIHMEKPLKPLMDEKEVLKAVHSVSVSAAYRPNIYLFVVESLREDFMTEENAKNISAFKKENISFGKTYSNANCTQDSWYSIFSSNYPFHWAEAKKKNQSGSVPLQVLKKLGYQIHVYSAAQLNYYGMAPALFGRKHYLADSYLSLIHI